jgi:hypothetical protein
VGFDGDGCLVFSWPVIERFVQSLVVEPRDVLDDREFELAAGRPGPVGDQLSLEAFDEALSNGVGVGIASSSLNAGGFQKHNSAKPGSDQSLRQNQPGSASLGQRQRPIGLNVGVADDGGGRPEVGQRPVAVILELEARRTTRRLVADG